MVIEWNYKGWTKYVQGDEMEYTQRDWNATILTQINKVAFNSGVEQGSYVVVLAPEHLKGIIQEHYSQIMKGMYNLDILDGDWEDDRIQVNGHDLIIKNFEKK